MPTGVLSEGNDRRLVAAVERAGDRLLALLGRERDELTVLLAGDRRVRELNRDYRAKDRPTDVLSFPQLDEDGDGGDEVPLLLGDVVISVETAARQAAEGGWELGEEINRLLLHGLLHLLGYDHERGDADAAEMQAEELRLAHALRDAGLPCACDEAGCADAAERAGPLAAETITAGVPGPAGQGARRGDSGRKPPAGAADAGEPVRERTLHDRPRGGKK